MPIATAFPRSGGIFAKDYPRVQKTVGSTHLRISRIKAVSFVAKMSSSLDDVGILKWQLSNLIQNTEPKTPPWLQGVIHLTPGEPFTTLLQKSTRETSDRDAYMFSPV